MSRTDDRRNAVLRAIVADYVQSGEPVGSKALVDRHHLGVSSATIRNDMSVLEEEGLIYQPHTSAGRIPTEKGYRAFVDQIASLRPLPPHARAIIDVTLSGALDIDDLVDRTVRLLAQLTHQLALVQYPSVRRSRLQHLEIVPVAPHRLLLVIITSSGRVDQRLLEIAEALTEEQIATLRVLLNTSLAGLSPQALRACDLHMGSSLTQGEQNVAVSILHEVVDALDGDVHERVVMAGAANLVRSGPEFAHSVEPLLDALEEQVTLLRLFTEAHKEPAAEISVSIGSENRHNGLAEAALISGSYGGKGDSVAHLGVIGPTRMDYPTAMTTVGVVARYLSRMLTH